MTIQDHVLKEYPNAMMGSDVTEKYLGFLADEFKSDLNRMLFATSVCSDDVNVSTDFRRVLKRPFSMGGLGGLPFAGYTGMVAFAHHIPDRGDGFIFYGPHIGITSDGRLGRMIRQGQDHETNSCGALMLALDRMKNNQQSPLVENEILDLEQIHLEAALMPFKDRILAADNQAKEITEVAMEVIYRRIRKLSGMAKKEFHCERIFCLGGVIINTDPGEPDYVDVRHFSMYNVADLEEIYPISLLE
jgi:regulator of replication initiation timing